MTEDHGERVAGPVFMYQVGVGVPGMDSPTRDHGHLVWPNISLPDD